MIGIYKITSSSGRVYVGQSINIEKRFEQHKFIKSTQSKLYNSIKKYGFENHVFEIIEECSLEQLDERETYYKQQELDKVGGDWSKVLFCGLYDTGGGPKSEQWKKNISISKKTFFKDKNKSKNVIEKISQTHKGKPRPYIKGRVSPAKGKKLSTEHKLKIGNSNRGRKNSEEHKQRISLANKNSIKPKSKETCNKISNSLKKSILQYDLQGNFIKKWDSAIDAESVLKINSKDINTNCRGITKKSHGYIWKYYTSKIVEVIDREEDLEGAE
jgi:group I intron endonuclease